MYAKSYHSWFNIISNRQSTLNLTVPFTTANPTPPPDSGDSGPSSEADSTGTAMARGVQQQQPQMGQPQPAMMGQPRPQWLNYPMMNQPQQQQQQGPYISGWNRSAQPDFLSSVCSFIWSCTKETY